MRQRQRRIATKHQPVRLDARKSRVRLHQPGASGATGALQPSEIFCIAEGLRWDAACLWVPGGFRRAPKLSPALEILSSPTWLRNNLGLQIEKPKSAPHQKCHPPHTLTFAACIASVSEKRSDGSRFKSLSTFEEFQLN